MKLLVVGAGITGSTLAHCIANTPGRAVRRVAITVWEKARVPGGRFCTHHMARGQASGPIVDTGAQYISRGAGREPDSELYRSPEAAGVIQKFEGSIANAHWSHVSKDHYVSKLGMSSIARHLLEKSGATVAYQRCLAHISLLPGGDTASTAEGSTGGQPRGRWLVRDEAGLEYIFDALALTLPLPQLLEVDGDAEWHCLLEPHREALTAQASRYSVRYAMACYYDSLDPGHSSMGFQLCWPGERLRGPPLS